MTVLEMGYKFFSHGVTSLLLVTLFIYLWFPKISGSFFPVFENGFISEAEWVTNEDGVPVLTASLGFNKLRNCDRGDPTHWFALRANGVLDPIVWGTRNLRPITPGQMGLITAGPWDFYRVPKDTVGLQAQVSSNCYGRFLPFVEGTLFFPLPPIGDDNSERMGIHWQRS